MNLEQMEARQAANVRPVILAAMTLFGAYREQPITPKEWEQILLLLYSQVEPAAIRSAEIAREFYDAERERVFPGLPRHDIDLKYPLVRNLAKDLFDVRKALMREHTTPAEIHRAALAVGQTVESAGRWTIMKAADKPDSAVTFVDDDEFESSYTSRKEQAKKKARKSKPGVVQGWARVATGRETCGWCLMLVSRGPVYRSAESAGAKVDNRDAMQMTGASEFSVAEHMNAWHPGCDCKIVPVFDLDNWSGKDRYEAAENMWKAETKGYSGKAAINAFRRATAAGKYAEYLAELN